MNENQEFSEVGQLNFGQAVYYIRKSLDDKRYYVFDSNDMIADKTFNTITDAFHWLDTNGKFARV